jgi:hypothetical protein
MSLVSENDMHEVLRTIADETGAAARAAHEYFDALTKTVLADLMSRAEGKTIADREAWARSQVEYKEHLEKVGKFAKDDYRWRQRYAAANAKLEIWRTENANARAAERVR